MSVNIIGIATAAAVADVNAVLEAMGRGPGNVSRRATTVPNPAWDAEPTHFYMSSQGETNEFQAHLLALPNDLPPLPNGVTWGTNGVIASLAAQAAFAPGNFAFGSFNDGFTPGEQVRAALDALGLHIIPDMET